VDEESKEDGGRYQLFRIKGRRRYRYPSLSLRRDERFTADLQWFINWCIQEYFRDEEFRKEIGIARSESTAWDRDSNPENPSEGG
jgi:hypothetical protein